MSKVPSHIKPNQLPFAMDNRALYFHVVGPGITIDDVMDPEYWEHLASRLKVGDMIEVRNSNFSLDIVLRVVGLDPRGHWAKVVKRGDKILDRELSDSSVDADGWGVDNDPVRGWIVCRGKEVVAPKSGEPRLPDKEAALKRMSELKAPARKAG
jgi:hypothetical protein